MFGENLRQLLLQPPIRGKTVMGLDPGYRMGCKVAVVDPTGKVLDTNVVYPVPEFKRVDQAKKIIKSMVLKTGWRSWPLATAPPGMKPRSLPPP